MDSKDIEELKKPFGTLVPDAQVTKDKLLSIVQNAKKIIAVGDATTERLLEFGILPDLAVVDGKERRFARQYPKHDAAKEKLYCKNPAGTISQPAVDTLKRALEEKEPVLVVVDGEEDMLALPIFTMALQGSIVLYGQPHEGLVVVEITSEKRERAKELMSRIMNKPVQ